MPAGFGPLSRGFVSSVPEPGSGSFCSISKKPLLKRRRKGRIKGERGSWHWQRGRACLRGGMGFSRQMGTCTEVKSAELS